MDIELELFFERGDGSRRRIGRAIVKDIDPAEFGTWLPLDDFAAHEYPIGTYVWNGWPAHTRFLMHGRLLPAPGRIVTVQASETCPDCGVHQHAAHDIGCDVARCLVTGRQRLSCDMRHEHGTDRWSGEWPGTADAARYGVTLNDLRPPAFRWDGEKLRWELGA